MAPNALRNPISRIRSVTDTSMMFMTPMPPTNSEMPATPPSRMVSVRSTEVAVERSSASETMLKSASVAVGDAVEGQQLVVGLLVRRREIVGAACLHDDRAHRVT